MSITALYPSNLARVMTCAGSVHLERLKDEDRTKRDEGEVAGELLQFMVQNEGKELPVRSKDGQPFDDDMQLFAARSAENILAIPRMLILADGHSSAINCEVPINWQTRSGIWINGRYDVSFAGVDNTLYMDDYKYGHTITEVERNWQLIAYAIGEIIRLGRAFEHIVLRIHQPRAHHHAGTIRDWKITYSELLDYKEQIEKRCEELAAGERGLQTSENCKYCDAAHGCPAFNKAYHRGIDYAHEYLQDGIDDDELGYQLDLVQRVDDLVKTRKKSLELLAITRINNGKKIAGWDTETTLGNRQWRPGISAEAIKMLTNKDVMTHEMCSPAQAEKMKIPQALIDQITIRKMGAPKLKRSDKALGNKIFGNKEITNGIR